MSKPNSFLPRGYRLTMTEFVRRESSTTTLQDSPPYVCTTDTAPPADEDCRCPDRCNCDSCGDARRP